MKKNAGYSARRMKDGERRLINPQSIRKNIRVEVIAHRVDADTPYVIIKKGDEEWWFEDVYAEELINRIRYALNILPTSK